MCRCLPTFLKAAVHDPYFSILRDGKGANANNRNRPIEDGRLRTGVNVIPLWPVELAGADRVQKLESNLRACELDDPAEVIETFVVYCIITPFDWQGRILVARAAPRSSFS